MDATKKEALDRFGRALMERVRDRAIRDSEMIVEGRTTAARARDVQQSLGVLSEEQREALHKVIAVCVDVALHHMLWTLDQEEWLEVAVHTDNGMVPSIRDVSDGLIGEKFDWIERFSTRPSSY